MNCKFPGDGDGSSLKRVCWISEADTTRNVVQDFKAMMIEAMLKSMRKASRELSEDGLLNSREQEFCQYWQLVINMSRGQELRLAEQIIKQVEALQEQSQ